MLINYNLFPKYKLIHAWWNKQISTQRRLQTNILSSVKCIVLHNQPLFWRKKKNWPWSWEILVLVLALFLWSEQVSDPPFLGFPGLICQLKRVKRLLSLAISRDEVIGPMISASTFWTIMHGWYSRRLLSVGKFLFTCFLNRAVSMSSLVYPNGFSFHLYWM